MNLRFRLLGPHDYPLLLEWLQRPHVKEWWDDGDNTLEKVAAHYSSSPETVKRYLLVTTDHSGNERPVGYFQFYIAEKGVGVDQFLADPDLLGKGLGSAALRRFLEFVKEISGQTHFITDPDPRNTRAIRCYEKVGFKHIKTEASSEGKEIYLMELKALMD